MATFIQKMNEKARAKTNEGFAAFRQGKELYFTFIKAHGETYGCGKDNPSLKQAYELYVKAEQVAQDENRFNDVAATHVELGKISELLGNYEASVKHRKKAIQLFESLPELNDIGKESIRDSYLYLAASLYKCGEMEEAKKTAELAIDKYRAAKDSYGIKALEDLLRRINSGTTEDSVSDPVVSEESMTEQILKNPATRQGLYIWLIIGLLILLYHIFFK